MKKILCIVLAMVLVLALFAGCSDKPADETAAPTATEAPAETGTPTEAPVEELDFSDATEVNLTFAVYLPDADATTLDMVKYMELIKEATEGTVDYTMYAGGTLVPAAEQLDAVRSGLADINFFPVGYAPGSLLEGYMLEFPGVAFDNGTAASYTVQEWYDTVQPEEIADMKLLFTQGQGNGCIMTTFPVATFEDLAGKQIRAGASQAPIIEAYGATPTVMVFSEVYEGLRTGVVQGFYGLAHAGNSIKLYEVTECVVKDPFYFGTYICTMNQDVWDSLTPDQQTAIEQVTDQAFVDFIAAGRDANAEEAYANFEANGLTVVEFAQADLDKMIGASGYLQTDYAADLDSKGYTGTENLDLFKELAAKYNEMY